MIRSRQPRNGFTLVELLVVIAIICILVATAYPVYTQVIESAHKVNALANIRQICAAMLMYANNNEGQLPCAFAKDNNIWRFDGTIPRPVAVPSGWPRNGIHDRPTTREGDASHWSHSIRCYTKSYELYRAPGLPLAYEIAPASVPAHMTPVPCAFTYNGLLHEYPVSGIVNPCRVPLIWTGFGKVAIRGFASTNPYLVCTNPARPCLYDRHSGPPAQLSGLKGSRTGIKCRSMWVYGKGAPMGFADGSARIYKLAASRSPTPNQDPIAKYDDNAVPEKYHSYSNNDTQLSPTLFMPDYDD